MDKRYFAKVYQKVRTTAKQLVYDGSFEGDTNYSFNTRWTNTGTLLSRYRSRSDDAKFEAGNAISLATSSYAISLLSIGRSGFANAKNYQYAYTNFTMGVFYTRDSWTGTGVEYLINNARDYEIFSLYIDYDNDKIEGKVSLNGALTTVSLTLSTTTLKTESQGTNFFSIASDGRYIRISANGTVATNDTTTTKPILDPGTTIFVGARANGYTNSCSGIFDGAQFYNALLSSTQLQEINTRKMALETSLIADYDFNEGVGTSLSNSGVRNFGGTIIGSPDWVEGKILKNIVGSFTTSSGGGATQGVVQATGYESTVKPDTEYVLACKVLTSTSKQLTLKVTQNNGGSTESVIGGSTVADEWVTLYKKFTSGASSTQATVELVDTDANAGGNTYYFDEIRLIEGDFDFGYFDRINKPSGSINYSYNQEEECHQVDLIKYEYVKTWADIINEPTIQQEINSGGSAINIKLARNSQNSGEHIDIDFGNEVRVYSVNASNINGVSEFIGYIENYLTSEVRNTVDITLFGYGAELDRYISKAGNLSKGLMPLYPASKNYNATYGGFSAIVLKPKEDINISRITLKASGTGTIYRIAIYEGNPTLDSYTVTSGVGTYSVSGSNLLIEEYTDSLTLDSSTPTDYDFLFNGGLIEKNISYYILVEYIGPVTLYGAGSGPDFATYMDYPPIERTYNIVAGTNNTGYTFSYDSTFRSAYCEIFDKTGATTAEYDSVDPAIIVRNAIDDYNDQGGRITYDELSIPLTNTLVSYDFVSMTVFEVINKCLELAPYDHYYYIDQTTNILHFKSKSSSPLHKFELGKNIKELALDKRSEGIVNSVIFTGGELDTGVNLYKEYRDEASISLYGLRSQKYVDARVKNVTSSDIIADRIIRNKKFPEVRVEVEVLDVYAIETIRPGDMVTFRNYGQGGTKTGEWDVGNWDEMYWDFDVTDPSSFVLQIARLEKSPSSCVAILSTSPPDVNKRIEDIKRNLDAGFTANNPSSPLS